MARSFKAFRPGLVFLMALAAGWFLPHGMQAGRILILPALAIMITITLLRFPRGFFRHPGSLLYSSIQSNIMNYLVLGNIMILTGAFLVHKQELWIGLVLVAAMPLSLETIPLGRALKIEGNNVFTAMAGTYLGALLIVPLVGLCFFKYIHLSYWNITILILCLILLPLVVSRLAVDKDWDTAIKNHEDTAMDGCHFVVLYTITANSKPFLTRWSSDLLVILAIALVSTFLCYFVIRKTGAYFHAQDNKINISLLAGSMKASGLAGGIGLTLFHPEVVVPAFIFAVISFMYTSWLQFRFRNAGDAEDKK